MKERDAALPWIVAFAETLPLARRVANALGTEALEIEVHRFPDGESLVRVECPEHAHVWVFRSLDDPNAKLVEVLLAADALRRQGAAEIGLVAPYLGYMRQDRVFRPGEPLSQRVMADLLGRAFDRVLTVEAHLHRVQRLDALFECPAASLSAADAVAHWLAGGRQADLLIGPDAESEPWIREIAERAHLESRVGTKVRRSDRDVRIELPPIPPSTKAAWVVDDIVSSGGTLEAIVRILKQRGVDRVGAIALHALFDDATRERLRSAGLDEIVSTDSIRHSTNGISLATLIANEIARATPVVQGTD